MTMAILKCEDFNSQQAIWCYADSCISTDSGVLTNHAMKIYEIQTKQYAYDQTMHKHLLHTGCLGFVYAGHVNIAMQTYSVISHIAQHQRAILLEKDFHNNNPNHSSIEQLYSSGKYLPLSLEHFAQITANLLKHHIKSFGTIIRNKAMTEIAIYGWCHVENKMRIFHLTPHIDNDIQIRINKINFDPNSIVYLGSGKTIIDELNKSGITPSRQMIKKAINHPDALKQGIGGFVQETRLDKYQMMFVSTISLTSNGAVPAFLGFPMPLQLIDGVNTIDSMSFADAIE